MRSSVSPKSSSQSARLWPGRACPFSSCSSTRTEPAAEPARAEPLYLRVADGLRAAGLAVETGRFGADMAVELVNDGPVTLLLEMEP